MEPMIIRSAGTSLKKDKYGELYPMSFS
jgi:hypothetical protein